MQKLFSISLSRVLLDFQRLSGSRSDVPAVLCCLFWRSNSHQQPQDQGAQEHSRTPRTEARAGIQKTTCFSIIFCQLCAEKSPPQGDCVLPGLHERSLLRLESSLFLNLCFYIYKVENLDLKLRRLLRLPRTWTNPKPRHIFTNMNFLETNYWLSLHRRK